MFFPELFLVEFHLVQIYIYKNEIFYFVQVLREDKGLIDVRFFGEHDRFAVYL